MAGTKKVLLTGIQPTGRPHLGNYFGMMRPTVALTETYDARISIVNLHALTTIRDGTELSRETLAIAIDFLAIGLDPAKATLFAQSDVPEVTELAWVFNCIVTVPFLERAHAYKDKVAKGLEPTVGLFDYPVLQAADILIQKAVVVPVGEDQRQHVEYARDIAEKFNNVYGAVFPLPEPLIQKEVAVVPGTDGQKMSKSYKNTIPLFATDQEIESAIMRIATDSRRPEEPKNPDEDTVFKLHALIQTTGLEDIRRGYLEGGLSYAESKRLLIEGLKTLIAPLRSKRGELAQDEAAVRRILKSGAERAREHAHMTMREVREKVGISFANT